ncbi:A24 family peptidase [Actinomadura nitritigenes]|uniref:Prepilin peptidase n=1 Tax=Actinomadura nitritigenes TaxID=134602 RepID=A0ABS3QRP1_9ACTN|nr:A24 family peptidase [Actinomadura nitritigenes]MBO2436648.1 prepilin peptidase [Actinomadura nitritigenes]
MGEAAATGAAVAGAAAGWLCAPVTAAYRGPLTPRARAGVAVLTGAVLAALAVRLGGRADSVAFAYLGVVGVLLAVIDAAVRRLPDPLTLPSYFAGAALLAAAVPFTAHGALRFAHALIGMAVLWAFYFVQRFLLPHAMGGGDVKLAGVLGLYLGWLGEAAWVTGVVAGFLYGGVYSVTWLLLGRAGRKDELPYGPFMLAGALTGILFGGWFAR